MAGRLMGQGVRSWILTCPYCGERYRLTNFMRRRGWWDERARDYDNTHLQMCRRRLGVDGVQVRQRVQR